MSDQNSEDHRVPSGIPLIHGPLTSEEKLAQERADKEAADKAFQERQVSAVEAANKIASRNTWLTGIAALIAAFAFAATVFQAHIGNKSWKTAQDTLVQMKADSENSSRQFQAQLGHFDAGLGRTGLLAKHAEEQAIAATRAAETSRDALVQVQRAVMTANDMDITRKVGTDGKIGSLVFFIRWKNVGGTATKNLHIRHSYFFAPQRLPNNFSYPDFGGKETDVPAFAAPQREISETPVEIPISLAKEIVDQKQIITFWGHADYRDVFKGTPSHTSQYCVVITGFYGNIYSLNPTETLAPMSENCKTHNCHDDECKVN